jgi:hypothetical protein
MNLPVIEELVPDDQNLCLLISFLSINGIVVYC